MHRISAVCIDSEFSKKNCNDRLVYVFTVITYVCVFLAAVTPVLLQKTTWEV